MFDALRAEFHKGLTDLATHTLGVAELAEGLDNKFETTVSGLLETIDKRFEEFEAKLDTKFNALKDEISGGEGIENEAVKALGEKVAAMLAPIA